MIRFLYHYMINFMFRIKSNHVKIQRNAIISPTSFFEGYNTVGKNSLLNGELGYGSYVGNNCQINGRIGRFCSIGNDVLFLTGSHPVGDNFSTSPSFYSSQANRYGNGLSLFIDEKVNEHSVSTKDGKSAVYVGDDVWIGTRVTILSGITIGDGAVIGAGAVVTKDVNSYEIVAGVPAKKIRYRFDKDIVDKLEKLKIWRRDIDEIIKLAPYMYNVKKLIAEVEEKNYEISDNCSRL